MTEFNEYISPTIRFPEFKKTWEKTRLNKILSVSQKKNKDNKYTKKDVLSVSGELGVVNQIEHLGRSYAGKSVTNYGVLEFNHFVYTKSPLKSNPFGIIKLNQHKTGIVSTLYAIYEVDENIIGEFINQYFSLNDNTNKYLRPLVRKGAKNDMKISDNYVLNDHIYITKKSEQKKIAEFLSSVDKKIRLLEKKKEQLELYKKGVMQKIFSREIRFKDDNGNPYPDWEEKNLGDICDIKKGKQLNKSELTESGSYPCINGGVYPSGYSENWNRNENTITISEGGNSCGYVNYLKTKFWCGGHCYSLLNIIDQIIDTFLFQSLKHNEEKIMRLRVGSGLPNIQIKELSKYGLSLPIVEEQKKIADFLLVIDSKIETASTKIDKTKEFKKGLLQQMFV